MKIKVSQLFLFLFLFITIASLEGFISLPIGNTTFWWIVDALMIFSFFKLRTVYFNKEENSTLIWPIRLFLLWNIICIVRGAFIAENYWEWKHLISTGMMMLLPMSIYISTNKFFLQKLISFWLKYALPVFFVFIPFIMRSDFIGRYLVPILFLLLFLPILPIKWKIIVLFFTFLVFAAGFDARSNIIRFCIAFLLGNAYYFRKIIKPVIIKIGHVILILLPLIMLGLAASGIFNVFKMDEYIKGSYSVKVNVDGEEGEESLTGDSRTFLYAEVISSALKNSYVLFGRTPSRGYDSVYFGDPLMNGSKTGKIERFGSEVSIHNIFTWTGIIGVILYFLVFFRASFLAIYKSNNYFMKIVGLFVAFRWIYAFIEDFTNFDLQYLFLWFIIGMCYSKEFRNMTDNEFVKWVRGIVSNKYRELAPQKTIVPSNQVN